MVDVSEYLHKWWERTPKKKGWTPGRRDGKPPATEYYYFFDIKSRNVKRRDDERTLYGFLAIKIVSSSSGDRVSFTNPGETYIIYYESFFTSLKKSHKRTELRLCIKKLFVDGFDKWSKKYSGWKNIL